MEKKVYIAADHAGYEMKKGIRAGLVNSPEITRLIRQHNNANVLVLPGRFMADEDAKNCVQIFLETEFEAGRHKKRIEKI